MTLLFNNRFWIFGHKNQVGFGTPKFEETTKKKVIFLIIPIIPLLRSAAVKASNFSFVSIAANCRLFNLQNWSASCQFSCGIYGNIISEHQIKNIMEPGKHELNDTPRNLWFGEHKIRNQKIDQDNINNLSYILSFGNENN